MSERTADGPDSGTASDQPSTEESASGGRAAAARGTTRRRLLRATAGTVGAAAVVGGASATVTDDGGAADTPPGHLRDVMFTCNAKDGSVSLYDARTFEPIETIDVYPDEDKEDALEDALDQLEPQLLNTFSREDYLEHVSIAPDGRTLYASRGNVGDVVAVDIETGAKLWETELTGFRADHQTISPDGRYLYTSDLASDSIDKIETATGAIVGKGPVRDLPHGDHYHYPPAFDGEATLINGSLGNMVADDSQTGDPMEHQLTFMDPETMTTRRTFDFEEGVRPMAVTADARKIYLQVSYFHGFHEYDVDENRVTRTKHLPKTDHVPSDESDYPLQSAHHGIDLSGDGKYICASGTTSWYAAIVRRSDFELIETIPVGEHPYWVKTGPTGNHAFVPVREDNEVAVIDYEEAEEIDRVPVGAQPHVTEYSAVPKAIL